MIEPSRIEVVRKHDHCPTKDDIYCGSGSALDLKSKVRPSDSQGAMCDDFRDYLWGRYLGKGGKRLDQSEMDFLRWIYRGYVSGKVYLVCDCTDIRCHCVTIRDVSLNVAERMRRKHEQANSA